VGRFDASYRVSADYEFLLRAGPTLRTAFLDQVTVEMSWGGASAGTAQARREARRAKIQTLGMPEWHANALYLQDVGRAWVRRRLLG